MFGIDATVNDAHAHTATGAAFPKRLWLNLRPQVNQIVINCDSRFGLRHACLLAITL